MILRKRQQRRITPDVRRPCGNFFAGEVFANRVVIKEDFQWRETLFTNGLGDVPPALVTLPTAQFVTHGLSRSERPGKFRKFGSCESCNLKFSCALLFQITRLQNYQTTQFFEPKDEILFSKEMGKEAQEC